MKRLSIFFNGAELIFDHSGALYWHDQRLLVVSDLHLEKSSSCAKRGQFLPPYDTTLTLKALQSAICDYQPRTILSLGDSFHDNHAVRRLSLDNKKIIDEISTRHSLIWIKGNHDDQQIDIKGEWCEHKTIAGLTFRHQPSKNPINGEIAGHLHPAFSIKRCGVTIRRFCFVTDKKRMIMPAFGAYTGGLDLRHKAFENLFDPLSLRTYLLSQGFIYPVQNPLI